ncbi:MAG TPA: hypothetical protein VMQ61_08725 [Thermoanaerobaculia bacterium]|nr:hypothetical protein [Thermoanaerobaculia bacterium]
MKRSEIRLRLVLLATVLLMILGVGSSPAVAQDPSATAVRVMSSAGPGQVTTHIWRRVVGSSDGGERAPLSVGPPPGALEPGDLQDAYKLPIELGVGRTVAIVAAMDDPGIEQDLAVFRSAFGLPPCTVASGCLRKVDQDGGTNLPAADTEWATTWALSVDMISAACPNCSILLVEARSATDANLGTAENTAAAQPGVVAISNSWGDPENGDGPSEDALYFNHPGIAITVSAGDAGYGVEYPASSPYVTAVGGTSLVRDGSARGWSESVWSFSDTFGPEGTSSGCSKYEPKPAFQTDSGCGKRTVADVAVVADPNTGVDVYDSFGSGGWTVMGGTDLGAPFVAGIYALAAPAGSTDYPNSYPYANPSALFDVTSGSDGTCPASVHYLCTAGPGYDGPTGMGTPNGIAAFQPPGAAADFSLSLSPGAATVVAGASAGVTVSTATVSGSAQSVALSTGALPAGVTVSFSPPTIDSGASSTLTLTTTSSAAAGATDISVTASNGSVSHDAAFTLTVLAPPPTLSIGVAPATIVVGSSATLSWSSANTTACTASGAWSSAVATAGSQSVSPAATGTFVYSLTCSGAGGSASGSATLTVTPPPPPTVTLTATPAVVRILESSRIEWTSAGAGACRASDDWRGSKPLDGSMIVRPLIPGVHTYQLTCGGPGGTTTATATVTVRPRARRDAAPAAGSGVATPGGHGGSPEAIDPREGVGPQSHDGTTAVSRS